MKVEIIANKLKDTDEETGTHYVLSKGDTVTVSDAYGRQLCDRGWAKDTSGQYASAEFTPGVAKLGVKKATHTTKTKKGA